MSRFVAPYDVFMAHVLDAAVEGIRRDYTRPDQATALETSLAAIEKCRGLDPERLRRAFEVVDVEAKHLQAMRPLDVTTYWRSRWMAVEIEWVCNVASVWLEAHGQPPVLSWLPTARGTLAAAKALEQMIATAKVQPEVPSSVAMSAQPCGCDAGAQWTCAEHQAQ